MEWYNAGNLIYRAKRHLIGLDIAELFCSAPAHPSHHLPSSTVAIVLPLEIGK